MLPCGTWELDSQPLGRRAERMPLTHEEPVLAADRSQQTCEGTTEQGASVLLCLRPLSVPPAGHDVPSDRGQGQLPILVNDKPTLAQERLQQWADLFTQFLRQVVIREGEATLYTARHVEHDGFLPRSDVEVHDVKVCEPRGRSTPTAPEAAVPQHTGRLHRTGRRRDPGRRRIRLRLIRKTWSAHARPSQSPSHSATDTTAQTGPALGL